jgi:hypothetical protein
VHTVCVRVLRASVCVLCRVTYGGLETVLRPSCHPLSPLYSAVFTRRRGRGDVYCALQCSALQRSEFIKNSVCCVCAFIRRLVGFRFQKGVVTYNYPILLLTCVRVCVRMYIYFIRFNIQLYIIPVSLKNAMLFFTASLLSLFVC